jgi:hypothetical protein
MRRAVHVHSAQRQSADRPWRIDPTCERNAAVTRSVQHACSEIGYAGFAFAERRRAALSAHRHVRPVVWLGVIRRVAMLQAADECCIVVCSTILSHGTGPTWPARAAAEQQALRIRTRRGSTERSGTCERTEEQTCSHTHTHAHTHARTRSHTHARTRSHTLAHARRPEVV